MKDELIKAMILAGYEQVKMDNTNCGLTQLTDLDALNEYSKGVLSAYCSIMRDIESYEEVKS